MLVFTLVVQGAKHHI